jgi:hypothetical protein
MGLTEQETINYFLELFYYPQLSLDEDENLNFHTKEEVVQEAKEYYQANQKLKKYMEDQIRGNE